MSTAVATRPAVSPSAAPVPVAGSLAIPIPELEQMKGLAQLVPGDNAEMFAKMMFGRGLGMGPAESLAQIDWIKGKAELSANAQGARMRAYVGAWGERYDYEVVELSNDRCILRFVRRWPSRPEEPEFLGDSTFTMEDAQQAGIKSAMYAKFPRNMLISRAMSNGVAWYAPETTYGQRLYSPGEVDPSRDHPVPDLPAEVPAAPAAPAPGPESEQLPAAPEVPEAARRAAESFGTNAGQAGRPQSAQESPAPRAAPSPSKEDYAALGAATKGMPEEQIHELFDAVGVMAAPSLRVRAQNMTRQQLTSAIARVEFTKPDAPPVEPEQQAIPGTAEEMPADQPPTEGVMGA